MIVGVLKVQTEHKLNIFIYLISWCSPLVEGYQLDFKTNYNLFDFLAKISACQFVINGMCFACCYDCWVYAGMFSLAGSLLTRR